MSMATAELGSVALERMEAMQLDENGADVTASHPQLQLSDKECQILELYDRWEEIKLQISLLQAQTTISYDEQSTAVSEKDIQDAQEALLEAKALYALRNTMVENVMIANPILKSVHVSLNATPIERDLRPLIEERDNLSIAFTETSSRLQSKLEQLTKAEAEHVLIAQKNAELAKRMMALAEETNTRRKEDITDPSVQAQLDELEESLKVSRQRWRIMKGTASAVVAGSGINWAGDAALRELVLDTEDD